MSDLRNKTVKIFSKIMEVEASSVTDDSNPDNIEGWDSLTHIELISAIEEEFSIQISPEDSIDLENFSMLLSFIEQKVQ